MKKKLFIPLLCAVMALLCAIGLVACGGSKNDSGNNNGDDNTVVTPVNPSNPSDPSEPDNPDTPDHVHSFAEGWESDGIYHWHESACNHDVTSGKTAHEWDNGNVTVVASCKAAGETVYTCKTCKATKTETTAKTDHDWEEDDVAATCLKGGYHIRTCKVCETSEQSAYVGALGHSFSSATCTTASVCTRCKETGEPALGHEYAAGETVEATCTVGAKVTYTCRHAGCNESYDKITGEPAGHNIEWTEERVSVATASTCYTIRHIGACSECDYTEEGKAETITAHIFSGVTITEKATCAHDGEKLSVCATCAYEKTEAYKDADAHSWDDGVISGNITTFTCLNEGSHTRKAVKIEDSSATVNAADLKTAGAVQLGNTSIELDESAKGVLSGKQNVNVAADELTDADFNALVGNLDEKDSFIGNGTVYNFTMTADDEPISNFNGKVTVRIPYELGDGENPDEITVWYVNGASVEEVQARYSDGYAVFETEHFSFYTVTRMTPAERCAKYGHAIQKIERAATCLVSGYTMTVCTRCGLNEKEIIPTKGHDWAHTDTAATCTKDGETVYTCGNCKESYTVKIPALNHKWNTVSKEDATCTKAGKTVSACENCGEKHEITLPQKDHKFADTVIAPTCTEGGYTTSECVSCGLKNVHSETKPLGHDSVVKTDEATCTEAGLKYEYCTRCEQLLNTIENIPATGHKLTNGICTVCGEGCKHNYAAGAPVAATCTEKGYTQYTCSVCKVSYKGNLTDALGHDFGVKECSRCHAPNPAQFDYYVNLIKSLEKIDFAVKFTDFSVKSIETDTTTEEEEITFAYEQLDVMEMYVRVEADGTLAGGGRASLRITEESLGTFTLGMEIVIYNDVLYLLYEDESGSAGFDAIKIDIEYIFREMSNGAFGYEEFREMYLYAKNELLPLANGVLSANGETLASVFGALINNLFIVTPTADGYKYTLNLLLVSALNDKVYELKVSELFDHLFGEGSFDKLEKSVTGLLDKTIKEVVDGLGEAGLSEDALFAAAEAFMESFGELIKIPDDFDLKEMYEEALKEIDAEHTTVADLLIMAISAGGSHGGEVVEPNLGSMPDVPVIIEKPVEKLALTEEDDEGLTKAQLKEYVSEAFAMAKESTVYELLVEIMGEEGEADSEDLYQMAKAQLDEIVEMIGGILRFEFSTDKNGFITGANIDVTEIPVAGWYGNGYEGKTVIAGGVSFIVGGEVELDGKAIADKINALVPVYEKDKVITAYSNYTKSNKTEYGFYASERGSELRIHTDANGNIVKVVVTTEEVSRYLSDAGNRYSKYFYYDESRYSSISEYDMLQGTGVQITKSYCGDWSMYSYLGYCTRSSTNTYSYVQAYLDASGSLVVFRTTDRNDGYNYGNSYYSSVNFYYNNKTKEYSVASPHEYELDEKNSNHVCEGYDLYVCKSCGKSYKSYLGHLGEREFTYELFGDNCEDGYLVTEICSVCHKESYTYESYGHRWDAVVTEYDLADYGSICGGKIIVRSCLCGRESSVETYFACDFEYIGLSAENTDDISWYEHTLRSCVVTNPHCAFAFEYKYYTEYDKACNGVEHRIYIFGQMKEGEFVPSGKTLEFTHVRDAAHDYRWRTVDERYDGNDNLLYRQEEECCRRCGKLYATYTYEYILVDGIDYSLISEEYMTRTNDDGEEYWSRRAFDYSDGEYCSPTITYTSSYGEYRTEKSHHYNSGYYVTVKEPTCTQSGTGVCIYCHEEELIRPNGHEEQWNSEKNCYYCPICGLEGINGLNGSIIYEDMSSSDEYKVGYYIRDYYRYVDKGDFGYEVMDFFMVNVEIVPLIDLEGDGMEVNRDSLNISEPDRCGSGTITFSVNEIAALAAENAELAEGYMVRLTFVPATMIGGNDYAITLDAQGV